MSKSRLIKRLKWYYPTEKFHAYVTFPVLLLYLLLTNPIRNMILMSYGLIVCIVVLYQGQYYWKLKLSRLKGEFVEQDNNIKFFKKFKRLNWILVLIAYSCDFGHSVPLKTDTQSWVIRTPSPVENGHFFPSLISTIINVDDIFKYVNST